MRRDELTGMEIVGDCRLENDNLFLKRGSALCMPCTCQIAQEDEFADIRSNRGQYREKNGPPKISVSLKMYREDSVQVKLPEYRHTGPST
jgi:hypothetical protein